MRSSISSPLHDTLQRNEKMNQENQQIIEKLKKLTLFSARKKTCHESSFGPYNAKSTEDGLSNFS